ncbi:LysE family transporter [Megasphaera vaginalis (ex Srinivasan et al. 2021)]|uniref:Putative cysteine/O-acetylserine efflux protein n=1 Tax=Megasphaera vaginalis (ex Srinivasan et al. 2021) TaxID=1111454 RepID=U7UGH7_9FIRM|nr:LysE family transporter [Megasphaera vaginalis (ex Srinivasan et al. 2021)]ERT58416.1 putative cysteine/O-acetylserine efflux protein [Megasphaera vaginalis (ex Srinivasan et al. 2021)]
MNFAAFFSYVFLTAFTPGPNNIMSMTNAGKYGFKKSFPFNLGIFMGFILVMSCCAIFFALLYDLIPTVEPAMLAVGAAYILWLAWIIWRDKPSDGKKSLMQTTSFFTGMILQFINVKVILYGITAMSSFVFPHYRAFADIAFFIFLLSFIGFAGTCCWSFFGAAFEQLFSTYRKATNLIMALALVYCAVTMLLDR